MLETSDARRLVEPIPSQGSRVVERPGLPARIRRHADEVIRCTPGVGRMLARGATPRRSAHHDYVSETTLHILRGEEWAQGHRSTGSGTGHLGVGSGPRTQRHLVSCSDRQQGSLGVGDGQEDEQPHSRGSGLVAPVRLEPGSISPTLRDARATTEQDADPIV